MRFFWKRSPRRTLILGVAALGVLLWSAVTQFDLSRQAVAESFLASLLALGLVILAAAATVALALGFKRLLRRSRGD